MNVGDNGGLVENCVAQNVCARAKGLAGAFCFRLASVFWCVCGLPKTRLHAPHWCAKKLVDRKVSVSLHLSTHTLRIALPRPPHLSLGISLHTQLRPPHRSPAAPAMAQHLGARQHALLPQRPSTARAKVVARPPPTAAAGVSAIVLFARAHANACMRSVKCVPCCSYAAPTRPAERRMHAPPHQPPPPPPKKKT